MLTQPVPLRRMEAFAGFILGLSAYHHSGFSWQSFALLFFVPDVGAIGYLKNHKLGGMLYNLTHWLIWPLVLGTYGLLTTHETAKMLALIWIIHVCFDRMLGWGFKSSDGFYNTDMGLKKRWKRKI